MSKRKIKGLMPMGIVSEVVSGKVGNLIFTKNGYIRLYVKKHKRSNHG